MNEALGRGCNIGEKMIVMVAEKSHGRNLPDCQNPGMMLVSMAAFKLCDPYFESMPGTLEFSGSKKRNVVTRFRKRAAAKSDGHLPIHLFLNPISCTTFAPLIQKDGGIGPVEVLATGASVRLVPHSTTQGVDR